MQCILTLLEHKPNFRESNNCDYAIAKGIYFQLNKERKEIEK